MKCKMCGKEIEDNSLFCKYCGKNQQETMKCKMCGKEIEDDSLFCKYCGKNQQQKKILPSLKGYQYAIIVLWLLINLYCLSTYTMDNAKRFLYPFQGSNSFHGPTLDYYDFSEFLLYGLGGVALMVSIWLYIGSKKKRIVQNKREREPKRIQNINNNIMKDYYEILGLGNNATDEQIEKAFKVAYKKWQMIGDMNKLNEVREAYNILHYPKNKQMYDAEYASFIMAENKDDYVINNPELTSVINGLQMNIKNNKGGKDHVGKIILWLGIFIIIIIFTIIGNCTKALNGARMKHIMQSTNETQPTEVIHYIDNDIVAQSLNNILKELPIHFEGLGDVREVDCSGDTVIFKMIGQKRGEFQVSSTMINFHNSIAKELLSEGLALVNDTIKEDLKSIASQSHHLAIIFQEKYLPEGKIILSSQEIKNAISKKKSSFTDDKFLQSSIKASKLMDHGGLISVPNTNLKAMWNEMNLTKTALVYDYQLISNNNTITNNMIDSIKVGHFNILRKEFNDMGNIIKSCIATNRNLIYKYINLSGNNINICFTSNELKSLINT